MIKECLQHLKEQDFDTELNRGITNIMQIDEMYLPTLLSEGIRLTDELLLYYYNGYGFKCINTNQAYIGRKPICNIIEKKLNEKLYEKLNS